MQRYHALLRLCSLLTLLLLPAEKLRDSTTHLTYQTKHVTKSETPAFNPNSVYQEVNECPVTDAEGEKNAEVTPLLIRLDIYRREILRSGRVWTISAIGSRTGI